MEALTAEEEQESEEFNEAFKLPVELIRVGTLYQNKWQKHIIVMVVDYVTILHGGFMDIKNLESTKGILFRVVGNTKLITLTEEDFRTDFDVHELSKKK